MVTLLVLTILLALTANYYYDAIRSAKDYSDLPRLAFLIFLVIQWIKRNAYQICGKAYHKAVPFFIYIMALFWFSNVISIIGFDSIGTSLVVPVSIAIVVFGGTVVIGIMNRGFRYFGDYLFWIKYKKRKIFGIPDPLKILGELSKVVSLACRLWGNTLAGSLILFCIYQATGSLFKHTGTEYLGLYLAPLFLFPFHIYFDLVDGTIQPMIFMLLTMCYWAIAQRAEGAPVEEKLPAGEDYEEE